MKTFIEIIKWWGGGVTIFGISYSVGMMVADNLYRTALGTNAYLDLNAISLWDMLRVFVVGVAMLITASILYIVFKSGERSAAQEEQKDE